MWYMFTHIWLWVLCAFLIGARYLRRTSVVDRARPILRRLTARAMGNS